MKLINYIRAKVSARGALGYTDNCILILQCPHPGAVAVLDSPPYPWEDEAFLKPVVDGDALLQYDFDGDEESDEAVPSKQYVT
mgnify:CR=1 FL=1